MTQATEPVETPPASGPKKRFELDEALAKGVHNDATDLHCRCFDYPIYRVHGLLIRDTTYEQFTPDSMRKVALSILNDYQKNNLEENGDTDLAYQLEGLSRFRVNVFYECDNLAIAFRTIPQQIPTMKELYLPENILIGLAMKPRGLVLVTGPTGSGKSTSLAAMINHINMHRPVNIITIEDPIEYKHTSKTAMISQREVGSDTISFQRALRSALRQDPDVILLGEMRDLETISTALTAAETGHLVFATLHTSSAASSVDRIIDVFPPTQQGQIRSQLANTLMGIMTQALLPRTKQTGGGRIVAIEILMATHGVRSMIREAKTHQIGTALEAGAQHGMRTMDMDLKRLLKDQKITLETALSVAHNPDEFKAGAV